MPIRENVDDGRPFVDGCVPKWSGAGCKRKTAHLEHELTWTYYYMKRHASHPLRREVGETLPLDLVPGPMRKSQNAGFRFWSDLRPPFRIISIDRVLEDNQEKHVDGELFKVRYKCGIDYCSERCYGEGCTFDNVCHGIAKLRIPDSYPKKRPVIVSWGRPMLGPLLDVKDNEGSNETNESMGSTLSPKAAGKRRATAKRRSVAVTPLQKLLLGPHVSLPRLVQQEERAKNAPVSSPRAPSKERGESPVRERQHRIFTASAGFVRYNG